MVIVDQRLPRRGVSGCSNETPRHSRCFEAQFAIPGFVPSVLCARLAPLLLRERLGLKWKAALALVQD